mmetsp:Transcript_34636/g.56035  ORF Transcript_34636/g.56035 Transcript_34636/m.56035 type:complete len:887 (-) Transcript_34636:136-2796(-)
MKFSIFVLRTLIFVAPFLGTVADTWTFDGALQAGDPTFIQPFSGYFVYYKVHTFTPITAGVYCIGNVAPTSISDTSLILYELSFDPSNILRNRVPYDNNSGPDQWAKITAYLTAGLPYKIVQTTYFGRQTGLYTLQIADQASCQASARPTSTPVPKCYRTSGSDITYSAIGTRGYVNYQRCSWLIEATGAAPFIHMNFTSFSTEGGYDFVTIYGGSDDSAPQLAKLSGNLGDLGAIDYYFASPIFVKFAADAGLTSNGFDAVLESVDQTPTPAPSPTPSASPIPLCYQTSDSAEISYSTIGTTSDYDKTCTWLVETTSAPFVRISVPYNLDMQYLEIFGGRDDSAPTLAKWRYYILAGDYFFPAPIFIKFYAYGYWESNLHAELAAVEVSPTPTPTPTPNPPPNCLQESNLPNITISSFGSRNTHRGDVCSWLIESTDKPFIHLTFSNVFLNYDLQSVTIYGGYNADSPQLKYLTGIYDSPVEYIFPSPVFVRFQVAQYEWYTPDASNGFDATVEALETRPQMACYQTSGSTGINYSNVGVDGPVSGYNQGCSWLVETTGAPFVQLTFTSFTLNIYGYYDQISVYGGTDDTAPLLEYIEGGDYDRLQRTYIFPSPFFIKYTTDPGQQGSVFTAALEPLLASPTPTPTPAPKCYQTSGSDITYSAIGTRGYDNNQQCSWLIEATGAAPFIHITFTSFDTELGYDSVNIYGGSNDSAPRLARLSGFYGSAVAYYLASPIFVTFSSDGSTTRDGFQATLEATNEEPRAPAPGQPSGSEPSGSSSGSSSTSSGELSSAAGFGIVIMISLLIFIINFVIGATIAFRLSRRGSSKKVSGATPTLKSTKATPASEQPTKSQGEPISLPTQSVVSSISISSSAQSALEDIVIRL